MKFVVDLNVNAWLKAIEIEASSKDEAKDILKEMSLEEDLRDNNVKSEEELDLPRTMELKLYDLESEDEDDIEDAIKSEIEFMTDFIVDEFTYEIIKKY